MNFITYLKSKKEKLKSLQKYEVKEPIEEPITEQPNNIKIVIENHHKEIFENEEEIILKGAQMFLEDKRVASLEEGIITFATIIRGLKYKTTTTDENGFPQIIFEDFKLEEDINKTL